MKTIGVLALAFASLAVHAGQTNIFPILLNSKIVSVMTNAEFRTISGRNLIFKQLDSGVLKKFDVTEIDTNVLAAIKVDISEAIAKQERIDISKRLYFVERQQQAVSITEQTKISREQIVKKQAAEKYQQMSIGAARAAAISKENAKAKARDYGVKNYP